MRRRLATILSAAMLSSAVLLPLTATSAMADASASVVLATEAEGGGSGLEPRDADNTENAFAPKTYEKNWTWRAGKVLLAAFLFVLVYIGLMYYLRVSRPARSNRS